ncbi:MAG: aspartate aminotransferase [Stappia sp.]|uniref:aminotransferase class I/II-fold pyridoxal phosphate-dependent enzyme n=1 Tax=Stappia sp. TaxID=1870903 RepID=UPI000C4CF533|nr:aminotransferase class I/II-fold pyridoxal phosphate-dependent enzyme [Stappia sp.]MAB01039.1 aspartate aminotransferase [Stappia sp.]MBM19895.1 aspartate aminotransferase [Stappia sp.]
MNYEAERARRIKLSPAMAVSVRARELRAGGADIIDLSVGEPDFDTPPHVLDAAAAAMRAGQTHYTAADGTPELKDAIIGKFERENGLTFTRQEISAGNGAKQVIFNALMATLEPGDEILVPAPYWVSYTDMALLLGAMPSVVECPIGDGFKLTPEKLETSLSPATRWLFLNSPGNPSGAAYTRAELEALGEVLLRYPRVLILSDEIYEHIRHDGAEAPSFLTACPHLRERTVIVNGVSKAYAMTGWRIGYAAGPADLIKVMAKIQSQSTSNPCSISQAAAVAALNGPQDFIATAGKEYTARRDLVLEGLSGVEGLRLRKPEGAFYAFVECKGLIGKRTGKGTVLSNDAEVAEYLLEAAGVATVPGAAFGLSPCFRLSFAAARPLLASACSRIADAVTTLEDGR